MKIWGRDLMKGMILHLNKENRIYGNDGHYAVGAYYDKFSEYEDSKNTAAAEQYENSLEFEGADYVKDANWLKEC